MWKSSWSVAVENENFTDPALVMFEKQQKKKR